MNLHQVIWENFSWTEWLWDLKIFFDKNYVRKNLPRYADKLIWDWFKNYGDYLSYYNSWDKRWKMFLKKRIDSLARNLKEKYNYDIDPIEYLIYLYYIEELSIVDIFKRVKNLGMIYKNESSLEKTFKLAFGWSLRTVSWGKITARKKEVSWQTTKFQEVYQETLNKKYKKIEDYIQEFKKDKFDPIIEKKFDRNYFENLNNSSRKFLYLIDYIFWLKDVDVINIVNLWLWVRGVSTFFNENIEFQSFLNNNNISFICDTRTFIKILDTSLWNHGISPEEKYKMINSYFSHKVKNIVNLNNDFDISYYESLYKKHKVLYLLEKVFWITQEDLFFLREKLEIWSSVITNFLNNNQLLLQFCKTNNINLKIKHMDIIDILK